jgi:hypothetical protein
MCTFTRLCGVAQFNFIILLSVNLYLVLLWTKKEVTKKEVIY